MPKQKRTVEEEDRAFRTAPRWAQLWPVEIRSQQRSALDYVNRRYYMYVRHVKCMLSLADGIYGVEHGKALRRILDAELRDATNQFTDWKRANGYA